MTMADTMPEWASRRQGDTFDLIEEPIDWNGSSDKANPHNWPAWKKVFHSAIPAIYSFGLYVSSLASACFVLLISLARPAFPRLWPPYLL